MPRHEDDEPPEPDAGSIDGLLGLVGRQRDLIIAVGTGGPNIATVDDEYQDRRRRIAAGLARLGLAEPFPWRSLWDWYGFYSSHLPTYQERRSHVRELSDPLLEELERRQTQATVADWGPSQESDWYSLEARLTGLKNEVEDSVHGDWHTTRRPSSGQYTGTVVNSMTFEVQDHEGASLEGVTWTLVLHATASTAHMNLLTGTTDQDGQLTFVLPENAAVDAAAAANNNVLNTTLWLSGEATTGRVVCPNAETMYFNHGSENEGIIAGNSIGPSFQLVTLPPPDHPFCTETCREGPVDNWVYEDLDPEWGKIARVHSSYDQKGGIVWDQKASADFQVGLRGSGSWWSAKGWAHVGNVVGLKKTKKFSYSGVDAATAVIKGSFVNGYGWMQKEDSSQIGENKCFIWEETYAKKWLPEDGFDLVEKPTSAKNSCVDSCTPDGDLVGNQGAGESTTSTHGTGHEIGGALCVGKDGLWELCLGGRGVWSKITGISMETGDPGRCDDYWYYYDGLSLFDAKQWYSDSGDPEHVMNSQGVPEGCWT